MLVKKRKLETLYGVSCQHSKILRILEVYGFWNFGLRFLNYIALENRENLLKKLRTLKNLYEDEDYMLESVSSCFARMF